VPNKIPYARLSIYGTLLKTISEKYGTLIRIGVPTTFFIHLLEGSYAAYLANSMGLSFSNTLFWFFQTLFAGYPSTKLIIKKSNQLKKIN